MKLSTFLICFMVAASHSLAELGLNYKIVPSNAMIEKSWGTLSYIVSNRSAERIFITPPRVRVVKAFDRDGAELAVVQSLSLAPRRDFRLLEPQVGGAVTSPTSVAGSFSFSLDGILVEPNSLHSVHLLVVDVEAEYFRAGAGNQPFKVFRESLKCIVDQGRKTVSIDEVDKCGAK